MDKTYDTGKLTKLAALKALAEKNKAEADKLGARVTGLENSAVQGVKVNGTLLALAEHIADILIAEGTENGAISVSSVNVAVHGLAALAYKSEVSMEDLAEALKTTVNRGKTAADTVDTLTGTGDGSISEMIDAAFNDFATKVTDDGVVNSYKELIDYAAAHGAEAAAMAAGITENKTAIANLKNLVGPLPEGAASTTVVGYIAEAIAALSIGDYAKTSEVTTAINTALANCCTKSEIDGMIATDAEVDAMLTEVYGE